jgi:chaperonin GroEL (HSP60 family)
MPKRVTDATILVVGGHDSTGLIDPALDRDWSPDASESVDPSALASAFDGRREEVISDIVTAGVDVVLARGGMEPKYRAALADHGILGVRSVNRLKLAQAALATGAMIVTDIGDIKTKHLGHAARVTVQNHDPRPGRRRTRKMTVIEGCDDPDSVTAMLPGTFDQGGEQLTRQVRKAAAAVAAAAGAGSSQSGVLPGGGATEVAVASAVRSAATAHDSKVQLALEGYADAMEMIPFTLAKNAGDDPIGTVTEVRARQSAEGSHHGYDAVDRSVTDVVEAGILDAHAIRRESLTKATEVANLILGIDDAVKATFEIERADPDDTIYDGRARQVEDARENGE